MGFTVLEPQSRFGEKLLDIWLLYPQNGTAVLKELTSVGVCGTVLVAATVSLPALLAGAYRHHTRGTAAVRRDTRRQGYYTRTIVLDGRWVSASRVRSRPQKKTLMERPKAFWRSNIPGNRVENFAIRKKGQPYKPVRNLILLGPQSRFGDKILVIRMVCPQNGTAVLKGSRGETWQTGNRSTTVCYYGGP